MLTRCIAIAHGRRVVAAAFALLYCVAGHAASAAEPDACIAGEYVIGCQHEKDLADIGAFRGDSEAIRKTIFDSIVSGKCKVFRDHDAVEIIDRTFVSDRRLVHRAGDANSFWIAARWTRPIGECGSAEAAKAAEPPREPAPVRPAPARQPTSAQNTPPPASTTCEIKPVMSDDDIAICHRARR